MKLIHLILVTACLIFIASCATHSHDHAMMGCTKCSCKTMKASTADSTKCAMCGHTAAEHNKPSTDTQDHSQHQQ